jgi:hypothetical protein
MQCPYVYQNIEMIKTFCEMNDIPVSLIQRGYAAKSKELLVFSYTGCVFIKGNLRR